MDKVIRLSPSQPIIDQGVELQFDRMHEPSRIVVVAWQGCDMPINKREVTAKDGEGAFGGTDSDINRIDTVYEARVFLDRRKMKALKIRIEDITAGVEPGESFNINYIVLEIDRTDEFMKLNQAKAA